MLKKGLENDDGLAQNMQSQEVLFYLHDSSSSGHLGSHEDSANNAEATTLNELLERYLRVA